MILSLHTNSNFDIILILQIEILEDYETTATPSGVVFNASQSKEVLTSK